MSRQRASQLDLGPMPVGRAMETTDRALVRTPLGPIFDIARDVEDWPAHLPHYRFVRFRERAADGGGIVEMSANRPFAVTSRRESALSFNWPTWWLSEMTVDFAKPAIRFRHIGGITKGMDVEWTFTPSAAGTEVAILHVWDGPPLPLVGIAAAKMVIGPVFIHGIASRTLSGLAGAAESFQSARGGFGESADG